MVGKTHNSDVHDLDLFELNPLKSTRSLAVFHLIIEYSIESLFSVFIFTFF